MITKRSKETIDACRFCWMCRHVCPVGNVTGLERNNPRGRAMSLALVLREACPLEDVIDNVYECALCGACTADCLTGWDPVAFTKEARLEAALEGLTPPHIVRLLDNLEAKGHVFAREEDGAALLEEIKTLPAQSGALLFLGANARRKNPKGAIDAIRLLKAAGVDFTVLAGEPDSGYALDFLAGAVEETRQAMRRAAKSLDYKTLIAYDPADAKLFLREYKEWDIGLAPEAVTFTAFLAGLELKLKKTGETYVFQDPAALARDLEETGPARRLLAACGHVEEMLLHGRDTVFAGNLIMNEYVPHIMSAMAQKRWEDVPPGAVLVTADPAEHVLLSAAKPAGARLMSLEQVILSGLE